MRAVLGAILVACVLADDRSFCAENCAHKYPEGATRVACNVGCDGRASISAGPLAFIDCQRGCDSKFSQETEDMKEARKACNYACMLPMTSSVYMSVKYNGGGNPDVKIVRSSNGVTTVDRPNLGASDLSGFIANMFGDADRRIFSWPGPPNSVKPADESSQESNSPPDPLRLAHARMMAMDQHMNEMLAAFSRQFFDGVRRHMQRQRHIANERPSEHDAFAHMGPEVGNMLSNGDPILITHPVDDENGEGGRPIKVVRYQLSSSHPPTLFYWIMIVFGVGALLLTAYASVIFFRVMRSAAYRRVSADGVAARGPPAPSGPGPIPVKKAPLDGWVEQSQPSGVPPPAYDQVSIHSIQKQKSDVAQGYVSTKGDSNAPSTDQK